MPLVFQNIILIFLGFAGFSLAFFIYNKKHRKEPLVCPLRSDCNAVVQSRYSKFLSMPVEILGMFYFGAVALVHAFFILQPTLSFSPGWSFFSLFISLAAFVFSIHLTAIQLFFLRQWCAWCLTSALICAAIFAITVFSSSFESITGFLTEHKTFITILHILGGAIGVGGATVTDILFFKFMRDYRISEEEADVMNSISQLIWLALGVLIVSGIALYLPEAGRLNDSAKFLIKMIAVLVLIINGVLLNSLVAPRLSRISFGEPHVHMEGELKSIRRLAFAFGAVSITSWYFVFILGALRTVALNFWEFIIIYAVLLFLAILGSQIFERNFTRIKPKE